MNIYVASFKQQDIYDYEIGILDAAEWFQKLGLPRGTVIKAGTILKLNKDETGKQGGAGWDIGYNEMLPAYTIVVEDYTLVGDYTDPNNFNQEEFEIDKSFLHVGRDVIKEYREVNGETKFCICYRVNVISLFDEYGPDNLGYTASNSIFDTCTSGNANANELPWTFITEGVVSDYICLQWRDAYNEAGEFSLTLQATDENIELFQPGRYLLIEESEKIMIIEASKVNANLMSDGYILQVSGRSLESILDRRVAFPGMGLNTLAYKGDGGLIQALYDVFLAYFYDPAILAQTSSDGNRFFYYPDRKIPFFEQHGLSADTPGLIKRPFNSGINKSIVKDDIYTIISETCKNNELGFRILAFPRNGDSRCINWKFQIYTGEDRSYYRTDKSKPPLIFSPILNNVKAVATAKDNSGYKNVIFCGVEKDSEAYIDLSPTNEGSGGISGLLSGVGIQVPNTLSTLKNKISNALQDNPVTYTGILILACAGYRKDKSYTQTIKYIDGVPQGLLVNGYPTRPISKSEAQRIKITFYKKFGDDSGSTSKTGTFWVDEINEPTAINNHGDIYIGKEKRDSFKTSTAYGWLTSSVLKEATQAANALTSDSWSISGFVGSIEKTAILIWFKTFDMYTGDKVMTKWLCQEYSRNSFETGIDRREVFVDQEDNDNSEWDASAITSFRQSTAVLKVNNYEDEETDEEVNARLMETARKQSSKYNKQKDITIDADTQSLIYRKDYDLGDIVQVDDGLGNIEEYMITGVVISNDTNEGFKMVPEFTKYTLIPEAYKPLEYITVANMLLPVIFSPQENVANSEDGLNYGDSQPPFGPDPQYYDGYIDEIFWERRSKVTEIEFEGGYLRGTDDNGVPYEYKPNFAMLSAVGYRLYEDVGSKSYDDGVYYKACYEALTPYLLLNSKTYTPLKLGATGLYTPEYWYRMNKETGTVTETHTSYYTDLGLERYIYQYFGDMYRINYDSIEYIGRNCSILYIPGASTRLYQDYDTTGGLIGDPNKVNIERLYYTIEDEMIDTQYGYKSLDYHNYDINKIVKETCDVWPAYRNELLYSISNIDEYRLGKKPQHHYYYGYNIYTNDFSEQWEYDYRYDGDYGHFNYDLPWNIGTWDYPNNKEFSVIGNRPFGYDSISLDPQTEKPILGNIKLISDEYINNNDNSFSEIAFLCSEHYDFYSSRGKGEGYYGQVPFNHLEIANNPVDEPDISETFARINSDYRYITIGGVARIEVYEHTINPDPTDPNKLPLGTYRNLVWDSGDGVTIENEQDNIVKYTYNTEFGDMQNGMTIKFLKIYECDSSFRRIRFSSSKRVDQSQPTQTEALGFVDNYVSTLKNAEINSENPAIDTRRLAHHYIPVEYVDVGDKKLENVEKYGLYDIIDQVFIPVNNNPLINAGFSGTNDYAKLIRAGGEITRE